MKLVIGITVVGLLAWIGFNVQQSESRAADARHERAKAAAAYLDCRAHAKYPEMCIAPTE
jgi:hypothetical protein